MADFCLKVHFGNMAAYVTRPRSLMYLGKPSAGRPTISAKAQSGSRIRRCPKLYNAKMIEFMI